MVEVKQQLPVHLVELLDRLGISELYPPQRKAVGPIVGGKNVVMCVPTAAGKSLVGYMAIVNALVGGGVGGKALYVVPLRALASEKFDELKKALEPFGLTVGLSTGELDESDVRLSGFDVVVCTSEKADSLLRHGLSWLDRIRVVVVDEVHLINDMSRGPTLEVVMARFHGLVQDTQLVCLSATVRNAVELADWLDATLVESDWRPVVLREGVMKKEVVRFDDGSSKTVVGVSKEPLELAVEECLRGGGQVLVFVNSRRSTVAQARNLGVLTKEVLSAEEKVLCEQAAEKVQAGSGVLSDVEKNLVAALKRGVAFHNAGLTALQRRVVEGLYRSRVLKVIVATPTLAAGVNVPARRVVIRDVFRFDGSFGMQPIPVLEFKQMAGRAGRPGFDEVGEAFVVAKNASQADKFFYEYVLGEVEPLRSKLGSEQALRVHVLGSIAGGFVGSVEQLYQFVEGTFYAYQADELSLEMRLDEALSFLVDEGFVLRDESDGLSASVFGKRTSDLYVDPLSAVILRNGLSRCESGSVDVLGLLHLVCSTPDVRSLYLKSADGWVEQCVLDAGVEWLAQCPSTSSEEYEWFLSDAKTALLVRDWIDEVSLDGLVARFGVWPGDVHVLVESVEWLLHAAREFSRSVCFDAVGEIGRVLLRVQHGCREELLGLIGIRGVGRVRARSLFDAGFTSVESLRGVPVDRLSSVPYIGPVVARSIVEQVGGSVSKLNRGLDEFVDEEL